MIRHIVLFNLSPEIETSDRDWLLGQIRDLSRIPSVRGLQIAKLLEPREDFYKARMSTEFGWALSMDFEDEDGLYFYQKDPYHVSVAGEIRKRASLVRVMDFVN